MVWNTHLADENYTFCPNSEIKSYVHTLWNKYRQQRKCYRINPQENDYYLVFGNFIANSLHMVLEQSALFTTAQQMQRPIFVYNHRKRNENAHTYIHSHNRHSLFGSDTGLQLQLLQMLNARKTVNE